MWRQVYGIVMNAWSRNSGFGVLPLIFAPFVLFSILASVFLTPPFQVPDENAHFQRAIQVSQGGVRGVMFGVQAGGFLPRNLQKIIHVFDDIPFRPENKATPARIDAMTSVGWDKSFVFHGFPNTVTYGPIAYAPGALGVVVGRMLRMSIIQTVYISRLANGLVFLALTTSAVALCRRGGLFLAVVLSLPMTVFLAGSISEDGIVIGVSALIASLLTRHQRSIAWNWKIWASLGMGFGIVAMAKPPLLALSLISCFLVDRREFRTALLCPITATALTFGWLLWGVAPVKVQLMAGSEFSDAGQVRYVVTHPLAFVFLLANTIQAYGDAYRSQFIGVLGWLDAPFPSWFYRAAKNILLVSFLFAFLVPRGNATPKEFFCGAARRTGVAASVLLSAIGIFFSLYVVWTKVGAPVAEGVQGRYFLPGACFLVLLAPRWKPFRVSTTDAAIAGVATLGFAVWLTCVFGAFTHLLAVRFW